MDKDKEIYKILVSYLGEQGLVDAVCKSASHLLKLDLVKYHEYKWWTCDVIYSPCGRYIVSALGYTELAIINVNERKEIIVNVIRDEKTTYLRLVFAVGDDCIATCADTVTNLWSYTGRHIRKLFDIGHVDCMKIYKGLLISACDDKIQVYNLRGDKLRDIRHRSFHISVKDNVVATCTPMYGRTELWNLHTLESLGKLEVRGSCGYPCFSHSGRYLAVGGEQGVDGINIYDVENIKLVKKLKLDGDKESDSNSHLCYSPCDRYLASVYGISKIRIWNTLTGKLIVQESYFNNWTLFINGICYSPCGRFLVAGGTDGRVRIMKIEMTGLDLKN